jgi:hypothetical protein
MWECLKSLPLLEDRETAKAVTAAVVSSQKLVRLWQDAAAAVLLRGPVAAAASAAVGSLSEERKKGSSKGAGRGSKGSSSVKAPATDAAGEAPCSSAVSEVAVPAWLVAAAEADPQAALRAGLGLLYRLLDCAQKAYYW